MIQTVIFDMDGVIVDTEPVHHYAYLQHFKALNIDVSPEMYASFTGNSTKNIYEKLKVLFDLKENINDLVETKRNLFNDAFDNKEDLYLLDGVLDLIQELYQNGMQLVLGSSSAKVTIDRVFRRFDLHQYFTHIVSGEDFPESKPHPALFLHEYKEKYDLLRDDYFVSLGLRMFRVSDFRVLNDLENVMKELEEFIIKEYSLK